MSGTRIHNKKRRLARWLTMGQVAEMMGLEGKEAPRQVRVQLLKVQSRVGVPIMKKFADTNQAPWYTTYALIARHAPEMLDTDAEAIAAVQELRTQVLDRVKEVDDYARALARETRNGFQRVNERLRVVERAKHDRT